MWQAVERIAQGDIDEERDERDDCQWQKGILEDIV